MPSYLLSDECSAHVAADGIFLIEVDRLLRPGGFFVWTSALNTHRSLQNKENQKKWTFIHDFAARLCWDMLAQQDETIIWKKTIKKNCYSSRYEKDIFIYFSLLSFPGFVKSSIQMKILIGFMVFQEIWT